MPVNFVTFASKLIKRLSFLSCIFEYLNILLLTPFLSIVHLWIIINHKMKTIYMKQIHHKNVMFFSSCKKTKHFVKCSCKQDSIVLFNCRQQKKKKCQQDLLWPWFGFFLASDQPMVLIIQTLMSWCVAQE